MAFIVSLIEDAIVETLETAFSDTGDQAGSGSVTIGRLMDDPEGVENPIEVLENDPDQPNEWLHEQATALPGHRLPGMPPAVFEIGGAETWARRFTVKLNVFLTREGLARGAAKEVINTVHGRAIHALRNSSLFPGMADEYGERVWQAEHCVVKSEMVLTGGPPTSWIGRGKLWVQFWTSLE
jgi:hypothetical protein